MAFTQDELDQVYNYVMGKGQSLAGLPDGGTDLSSMYLAPLLKYSPDGKASLVRLAVAVLKGDSAYQVWVKEPGNEDKSLSDFFAFIKGAQGDPFTFADFTPEQLADLALTYEKLTPEQKEEMKLHFGDLSDADILVLQKPATDAAEKVLKDAQEVNDNLTAEVGALKERAETVIRKTGESKDLADQATKSATDAANLANEKADLANNAAVIATEKAGVADNAAQNTFLVKQETEKSKDLADQATKSATDAASLANEKADLANNAAVIATEKAGVADKAAQNADKATEAATKAANRATTLSNNRDKIVAGYWWKYDEELQDYVNTTIRATGETGQGLNIVSRYLTVDELKTVYPDGVVGCFEIGDESPYEIWYYDAPASEWRNSGRLQGPQGMSAFQVWKLQPGNENKTEFDFFKSLSPYIGANKNWWLNGVDLGIKAPGTDAYSPRINKDSHKWEVYDDEQQKYVETDCLAEGVSVKVEIVKNTPTEYKLKFTSADGEFITPNLIVRPVSNNGVLDIDHEPTAEDTHYTLEGVNYPYAIGQEVRFKDGSDITFYKCYDNSDAGAVWEEAGAGGAPVSNIYLQGANYFNRTVQVIRNGYIENKEVSK